MGNSLKGHRFHRHRKGHHGRNSKEDELQESLIKKCFWSFSDGNDTIKLVHLEHKLGNLAEPLYKYLSDDDNSPVTLEEFHKKGLPLLGNSTDIYIKIFQPFEKLLEYCFEAAEIEKPNFDEPFMKAFIENMKRDGDSPEQIAARKNLVCPGLIFSIQSRMFDIFYTRDYVNYDFSSDVLSPAQMYILRGMLPETVYFVRSNFQSEDFNGKEWDLLWSSKQEKISPESFQRAVFEYQGPTVLIFRKTTDKLYAVANDEQWENSSKKIGGNYCSLLQLLPELKRIDGGDMLYCNFKLESMIQGIMFGSNLLIESDMRDVKDIEVWGCGLPEKVDEKALEEYQKQLHASEKGTHQHSSTGPSDPRPTAAVTKASKEEQEDGDESDKPKPKRENRNDNWDVDKQLLEMAGFEFDRHRRVAPPPPPED